ncbi:MAG: TRAP transporter substrate-binding protein, partial [Geminicoccaceae bacterium]
MRTQDICKAIRPCGAAVVLAIGLGAASEGLAADQTLRFAHMWPPDSGWGQAAQKFADLVQERTGGRYEVKVFPQGQLGNERELEEGLQIGNLDFTFGGPGVLTNFDPLIGVFDLPFLFESYEQANEVMDGPIGAEAFDSLRENAGIRVLASGAQGFRYVLTKDKPIGAISDIEGLKIRVPEAETFLEAFRLIGANPVPIPWGETYTGMQTGVVDGLEGVPEVLQNFKMYEVGKNVARTGHVLATLQLLVSEQIYQGLPDDVKQIVDDAAREAWHAQREAAQAGNVEAEATLEQLGVVFTDPPVAPFQEAVRPYWDEWGQRNDA